MLLKPTPVESQHDDFKIEAEHLNYLIRYYNEIWEEPESGPFTFDANHITGTDDRRFGWGQTPSAISPIPSGPPNATIVTISDINQAIAQVNAGLYHTEDDPTHSANVVGLYSHSHPILTDPIPTTLYNDICDKAATLINDKYKVDWANLSLAERQDTYSNPWQLDLAIIHKFTFTDYNEARNFFNSGGELALELSMAAGGPASNMVWQTIFDQFDSIRIGAETCRVVSDTLWDVISTSGVNKGFYTGIEYSTPPAPKVFTTILDAGVFRYQDDNNAYAYVYVYSEYNSRRIRIQLAADETTPGGTFNVYVKVILIEDADDTFQITQPITLTSGYVQPSTTPLPADGNASFMTEGSTLYQFIKRAAPTVTLDTAWVEGEYGAGEQLNWASTDPGTNWDKTSDTTDSEFRHGTT